MRIPTRTAVLAVLFLSSLGVFGVVQRTVLLGQVATTQGIIVDDRDPDFAINNFTSANSIRGFRGKLAFFNPYAYGSGDSFGASQFTFKNLPRGGYDVYATWPAYYQNTQVTYELRTNASTNVQSVAVDQKLAPATVQYEGTGWRFLGTVFTSMNNEQIIVTVIAGRNALSYADAVMVRPKIQEAVCGNAVKEGGEECDDGNQNNADACTTTCRMTRCGDGSPQEGEQCDDGNQNDADWCTNTCRNARCGDGIILAGEEQCDDSNMTNGDGCSAACRNEPRQYCGNGILEAGEQCDDGNQSNTDPCTNACQLARCGDAVVQQGEECDDGNSVQNDSCSNDCRRPPSAGTNPANARDVNSDGRVSTADATLIINYLHTNGSGPANGGPPFLDTNGDGFVSPIDSLRVINWLNEHAPTCGDGIVTGPSEQCDDDNTVNTDSCTNACRNAACGDSFLQTNEQCDDGNQMSHDGCSSICQTELPTSEQRAYCGNGSLDMGEQCDDGNGKPGDGCTADCTAEICGDATVNNRGVEECDTGGATTGIVGNSVPGVGCTAQCTYEYCGDGVVQGYILEQCDDGNRTSGDGCDNICHTEHAAAPELSVRTTVPPTLQAGTNVDYLYQVTNNGSEDIENVTLVSSFFEGDSASNRIASPLRFVSARFGNGEFLSCAYVAEQKFIRCTVPVVAAGSTRTVVLTLAVPGNQSCGRTLQHQADLSVAGYSEAVASVQGRTTVQCQSAACRYPMLTQSAWQNKPNPLDVDNDGFVTRTDAYLIAFEIDRNSSSYNAPLPQQKPDGRPFLDTDGNTYMTPRDTLLIVNYLNGSCQR